MKIDGLDVHNALSALGELLDHSGAASAELVVFGGSALRVLGLVDRSDQICLKLHAVVDRDAGTRHLTDLMALKPTTGEMLEAARWCRNQDVGEQFSDLLKSCLVQIGYAHVADSL